MSKNKKTYIVPNVQTVLLTEHCTLLQGSNYSEFGGEGNGIPAASDRRVESIFDNDDLQSDF